MKAVSIGFYALPTSKNIKQDRALHFTAISITEQANAHPDGLTVTGVFVDGVPVWSVPIDSSTVAVRPPLKQQGERVEVRCVVPVEATTGLVKALQWPAPAYPTTEHTYGLTARQSPEWRHSQ